MAKVFRLFILCSVVFHKVSSSNETCSTESSKVFQTFEELLMSRNLITVTDGIRMRRKSLEKIFQVNEVGEEHLMECGSWTMRNVERNIDKIMSNFVLEFDLSKVSVRGL